MSGRKTIMVDTPTWKKIDDYKHDLHLRNIGDAIEDAIDTIKSDEYYAGVYVDRNEEGKIKHYIVESLGKTEEEALRNLLLFEQGSLSGEIRLDDIPPFEEFDEDKDRFFITEFERELYYDLLKNTDVNTGKSKKDNLSKIVLYSCDPLQCHSSNKEEELPYQEPYWAKNLHREQIPYQKKITRRGLRRGGAFVLVNPDNEEIIAYSTSDVELHRYFKNTISNGELKFNTSNLVVAKDYSDTLNAEIYRGVGRYHPGTTRVKGCFAHLGGRWRHSDDIEEIYRVFAYEIKKEYYCVTSLPIDVEYLREKLNKVELEELENGEVSKEAEDKIIDIVLDIMRTKRDRFLIATIGCGDSLSDTVQTIPSFRAREFTWVYNKDLNIRVGIPKPRFIDDSNQEIKDITLYMVTRCSKQYHDEFDDFLSSKLRGYLNIDERGVIEDVLIPQDETNPDAASKNPERDAEKTDEEKPGEEKND